MNSPHPLVAKIEGVIADRKLLRDGQRILVAVSGGVDSMVLLALLHEMAPAHRWQLAVAHFNHQLRGRAGDAAEKLVARQAEALGLPFIAGSADVKSFAGRSGLSVEMAARELRHKFLAGTAARRKIPSIALAHHAGDQVELFFLRLLRGTGSEGLAGMKSANPSPWNPTIQLIRPLLDLAKSDFISFARDRAIRFSEDATNASLDIRRNRIRRELLPLLRRHYQPALERAILRCMELLRADSESVGESARRWLGKPGRKSFDRLTVAVQRRVLQAQLFQAGQLPDFEMVEHLRTRPGQPVSAGPGCWLCRDSVGRVRAESPARTEFKSGAVWLKLAGRRGSRRFGGVKLTWELADEVGMTFARRANEEQFDADKVGPKIRLRHWQPGDAFRPIGAVSPVKLQDLFTNLKVPKAERRRRVVALTADGRIFWTEGLRIAEDFKLDATTRRRLKWSWQRQDNLAP